MTPEQIKIADKLGATQYCILDDGNILLVTDICGFMFTNKALFDKDEWKIPPYTISNPLRAKIKPIEFGSIK